MTVELSTKTVCTVVDMARAVGLSRARFYQLIGSAFPFPVYNVTTRRPFFNEELQRQCLEVRRRNCGIDGKPILFYARRLDAAAQAKPPKPPKIRSPKAKNDDLIESLKALGLTAVTQAEVQSAVTELFPQGVTGTDQGEVIRAVFLHLKRKDSGDSVGR